MHSFSKMAQLPRPIHIMTLKSAPSSPVNVIGKFMIFVELSDLHVRFHFGFVDSLSVVLLFQPLLTDMFVKRIIPLEQLVLPILTRPVKNISENKPPSHPLAVFHNTSDFGTYTYVRQDENTRNPLFRIKIFVEIPTNKEASVSVTTSSV